MTRPPVPASLFLAQFDARKGYEMVWYRGIDPAGLEYKALPSGIHNYEATTIYLTHKNYFGSARYRQVNLNAAGQNDRALVKMCSLGVLCEAKKGEFGGIGWEFADAIDEALVEFLSTEKDSVLEKLWDKLSGTHLDLRRQLQVMAHHPLSQLPLVFSVVGPLFFSLHKAALLRKRILIFGPPLEGGALAYLLAVTSLVPEGDLSYAESGALPRPLYTVTLHDMDGDFQTPYIATTSDDILRQHKIFDYMVDIGEECEVNNSTVKATFNDYGKFVKVYRRLPVTDDASSIQTSSSVFSTVRMEPMDAVSGEPAWWLRATSPMLWREYIWLAFSWFASAGTTNRRATEQGFGESAREGAQFAHLAQLVGQFHRLTKKWFAVVEEIVAEVAEDEKVVLELTYQDVVDMELDPYSEQDLEFVREFVLMYWHKHVKAVEVGVGVRLCC